MSSNQHDRFSETIEPIARPQPDRAAAVTRDAPRRKAPWIITAGIVVLVGVAAVLLWPDAPEQAPVVSNEAPTAPVPAQPAEPVLSEEEQRRLDALSQRDLAALLTQQDRLRERDAPNWGAQRWIDYLDIARAGDDAYLAQDYAASSQAYIDALALGEALLEESVTLLDGFIAAGNTALDAGDWRAATQQFEAALAIDPGSDAAATGLTRAQALPRVLALMDEGAAADDDGDLPAAIERYSAALQIDGAWEPARTSLADARSRLAQYEFEQFLDRGYGALAESRFADALEAFDAALAMRPDSTPAADGRFQALEGQRLGQIALARVRALAFERRELWDQAIAQYEAALQTDATLEYAIEGLERSRQRRDLEAKLMNLLDNPRLLFEDRVLADAHVIREQAAAVMPRGAQIDDQLARLDRLIAAATREYAVPLVSDGLTSVTVFRVGTIGAFAQTEVNLRPGTYTIIGSRNGFRDVRKSLTVLPGQTNEPLEIICTEPI